MERRFAIAGVPYCIKAEHGLEADGRWSSFASEGGGEGQSYLVSYVRELPIPEEMREGAGALVRSFLPEGQALRVYYKEGKTAYAAVRERTNICWEIWLKEEFAPWGSRVEHMFEQYALSHSLLYHKRLLLHCAYILTDYGAVLFTAPSGTGKSTQAELWRAHRGSRIINGDRGVISVEGSGALAHGLPNSGSSADCHNESHPIRAIVCLGQSKENRLRALHGMEALRGLLRGCYLLPEFSADLPALVDLAGQVCETVPLYRLDCLPDVSAVEVLETALSGSP